ncbi:MAG: carboxymethylenebutenolidase [Tistrella sp.]|uniref:Carboxymethylenebutenolidase n=1 Tax=Tistrella mobilis TaxID=171437 RepID=A0A3B9IM39_9PROT|nr:dienelactone hydrolase family protein [Tistrella sp.]MAD39372.1 carboxymethylenebutenolidase [Tistrella sp.]MBA76388.1 carboxymethylenebutenolidase [Tistrella sp.]HAE48934.1 carboxymethylenebutenolidase [Tistrella mobilis]
MGEFIRLDAATGTSISAWHATPRQPARAGLVVLQEIFGVNAHIRGVADRLALPGYEVVAPALFDRVAPDTELGYGPEDLKRGIELKGQVPDDEALTYVAAAVDRLRARHGAAFPVGVVGFCWGGSLAYLAAAKLSIDAAVSYYGGQVPKYLDEGIKPVAPLLVHLGGRDGHIPAGPTADKLRVAAPGAEIYVHPQAGHGFNCEARPDYRPEEARYAMEVTLRFLDRRLSGPRRPPI